VKHHWPNEKPGTRKRAAPNWEIYRWLCPGSELAARFYEAEGKAPAGFETPDGFYARHRIIPLVPVSDFSRAPAIKARQRQESRP
jgi:hypothetical protein